MQLLHVKKRYLSESQEMSIAMPSRNLQHEELKPQSSELYRSVTVQLTATSLLSVYTLAHPKLFA
jgi:hypothetical protein